VPVLYPPAVRVFDGPRSFAFANPTAMRGPGMAIHAPSDELSLRARLAAVIAADGAIGGYGAFADWRAPTLEPPKDRDFASALGPAVVTPDEIDGAALEAVVRVDGEERARGSLTGFDWKAARAYAEAGTSLRPGDVLAGPAAVEVAAGQGTTVELEVDGIGILDARLA
jgi:2-keto-4-pentenoate hydratase/2-oxohepta-3-ene-1,7-dioic acid hydratase in catechol pathway